MIFVDYHVQCALLTLIMHTARDSQQKSPSTTTTTIQQPFIRKAHLILGASKCTLGALHPLDAPPRAESFFFVIKAGTLLYLMVFLNSTF